MSFQEENENEMKYQGGHNLGTNSTIDPQNIFKQDPISTWLSFWQEDVIQNYDLKSCYFCPYCLKGVKIGDKVLVTQNQKERKYFAHASCNPEIQYFTEFTYFAEKAPQNILDITYQQKIGSQQFMVIVQISHPLNTTKFYTGISKLSQNILGNLTKETIEGTETQFQPNKILIPLKQFSMQVQIQNLSNVESMKKIIKFMVNLNQCEQGICVVNFKDEEITFNGEFQIIKDSKQKQQEINNFNLKYPFSLEYDIVKMKKYLISMENVRKEEFYEPDYNCWGLSPLKYENQAYCHDSFTSFGFIIEEEEVEDREFVALIKTQAGSKDFQKKVKNMTFTEIQESINKILPLISQIVLNQYANYALQSLFKVCSFEQRIRILESIQNQFVSLVCSQIGTFVLQKLIDYLTKDQEYELIFEMMKSSIEEMFFDQHGNHFMRKYIKYMPKHLLFYLVQEVLKKFVKFAVDKNAMCVLKSLLSALSQGEKEIAQLQYETKKIIDELTLNTNQLANDKYGNFLIQRGYEVFSLDRMSGVTEYIIKNFSRFSCKCFSSSFIQNCIKIYWRKNSQIFKSLEKYLEKKNILKIYNSKEGNKCLLEIMILPHSLALKDKLENILQYQQSPYDTHQWTDLIGKAKTGSVGNTSYSNFSEAHSKKKPHYLK